MAFKIRDLMITDLTESVITHRPLGASGSRCTTRDCATIVTINRCRYSDISLLCGVAFNPDPAQLFEQLALLKAQLKEELGEIEKEQEALDSLLRPRSLAEVEELQLKVAAAAEELANMKEELAKKQS